MPAGPGARRSGAGAPSSVALTVRERPGCWTLAFGSKPRRALYEVQAGRQLVLVLGHVAARIAQRCCRPAIGRPDRSFVSCEEVGWCRWFRPFQPISRGMLGAGVIFIALVASDRELWLHGETAVALGERDRWVLFVAGGTRVISRCCCTDNCVVHNERCGSSVRSELLGASK